MSHQSCFIMMHPSHPRSHLTLHGRIIMSQITRLVAMTENYSYQIILFVPAWPLSILLTLGFLYNCF